MWQTAHAHPRRPKASKLRARLVAGIAVALVLLSGASAVEAANSVMLGVLRVADPWRPADAFVVNVAIELDATGVTDVTAVVGETVFVLIDEGGLW